MKLPQTGGCLCGKIRYEISEAPRLVYTCHCTECQRLTSSAFSIALAVAGFASQQMNRNLSKASPIADA